MTLTVAQQDFLTQLLKQVTVNAADPKSLETIGYVQAILKQLTTSDEMVK